MKRYNLILFVIIVILAISKSALAKDKAGFVISYGGGFGHYNISYRNNIKENLDLEAGIGYYNGTELLRTFPGELSNKDKPLDNYIGLGLSLVSRIKVNSNLLKPSILFRCTFDNYHGPGTYIGAGYEYYFTEGKNVSFLIEGLLGALFTKSNYIKIQAPNSDVDVRSIFNGQLRAGFILYL